MFVRFQKFKCRNDDNFPVFPSGIVVFKRNNYITHTYPKVLSFYQLFALRTSWTCYENNFTFGIFLTFTYFHIPRISINFPSTFRIKEICLNKRKILLIFTVSCNNYTPKTSDSFTRSLIILIKKRTIRNSKYMFTLSSFSLLRRDKLELLLPNVFSHAMSIFCGMLKNEVNGFFVRTAR